MDKTKPTLLGRKELPEVQKKPLLITFQETYIRETMFSRESKFLRIIFFKVFEEREMSFMLT